MESKAFRYVAGIRARGAADRGLIHQHNLLDERIAFDAVAKLLEADAGALGLQGFEEHVMDQRGFAGAGDAGDGDHGAERKHDVDVAQVMRVCAKDAQKTARWACAAAQGRGCAVRR